MFDKMVFDPSLLFTTGCPGDGTFVYLFTSLLSFLYIPCIMQSSFFGTQQYKLFILLNLVSPHSQYL